MSRKKKGKSLKFLFLSFILFGAAPSIFAAAGKRPIILGIGGGYSFILDSKLRSYEVYYPQLIYFSEQLSLKHDLNLNLQYFPWRGFGFQLEFDRQAGGYTSDLKWYGYPTDNPLNPIAEVNYIEDTYRENWSISSIAISIIYVLKFESQVKVRPYVSAGVGYHFLSGDQERFKDRTRLGPEKSGRLVKLGLGIKYQLTPKFGVNIRGSGMTMWRKEYGFGIPLEIGPKQFDYEAYDKAGKIIRQEKQLVNSFSCIGITMSLEYTF
jgi:hypothetical protein